MSLEDLGNIGEFVAAVAVIASLVYLAVQIRQNTESTRLSNDISISQDVQHFRAILAQDSDAARIYRDGLKDLLSLDEYDRWRFGALMQHLFSSYESSFRVGGAWSPEYLKEGTLLTVRRPGARQWWQAAKRLYSPEFQRYIDALLQEGGESEEQDPEPSV